MNKKITPLPWRVYFIPTIVLALAGLADSIYLAFSHYKNYTDIAYSSFCALSKAINCDTVSQSPWSIFLGLPMAFWGIIAYLLLLILVVQARWNHSDRLPLWSLTIFLTFFYSLGSILLGYISAVKIKAYCVMCIISYGINFFMLFYSYLIFRRFCNFSFFRGLGQAFGAILNNLHLKFAFMTLGVLFVVTQAFFPHYWQYSQHADSIQIPSGMTDEGHPWIGAEAPLVTIEEYTDYQCFQCRKMHFYLRNILAQHPDKIRLVHRHFPLDREVNPTLFKEDFHVGSGRLALLAIAASYQGAFWPMNDALYNIASQKELVIELAPLAQKLGLDLNTLQKDILSRKALIALQSDIRAGLEHKISGTPSYVINGEVFAGTIPADVLKMIK